MKFATWRGDNNFTIDEEPDPIAGPGEVVVRIETASICGTEVHVTQGLFPNNPPSRLGHELSGTIVEVGKGVDRTRLGQPVACDSGSFCRECFECLSGRTTRCVEKVSFGGYAEYIKVPEYCTYPVPDGVGLPEASLTEPASCCLIGLERSEIPPGASVLVIGGGIMGQMTLGIAKLMGAGTSILSDPVAERRDMAKQLGADIVHDPGQTPLRDFIMDVTDGRGVQFSCEAVGKPELVDLAIQLTRKRGTMEILGVCPKESRLPSDLYDIHFREIKVVCSFGRGDEMLRALDAMARMNLDGIIGTRYPLEQIGAAFKQAASAQGMKTAIAPHG